MKATSIQDLKKSNAIYLFIYQDGKKVILEKNLSFADAQKLQVEYNKKGIYPYYTI